MQIERERLSANKSVGMQRPLQGVYDPLGSNIFSTDFVQSVASSMDEFESVFRPDVGDINFERDFGQWFNQGAEDGNNSKGKDGQNGKEKEIKEEEKTGIWTIEKSGLAFETETQFGTKINYDSLVAHIDPSR